MYLCQARKIRIQGKWATNKFLYRRNPDEYFLEFITNKQTGLVRQKEDKIYN